MKIVATIEARMESSRLPGKTLAPILGRPMLEMLIERLRRARRVDQVVVATTDRPADQAIEDLARRLDVGCFRGSSDDVLDRVLKAAQAHGADLIVEMTGDCPLLDPTVVDEAIAIFLAGSFDYVSNVVERTYPRGLDTQVYPVKVLAQVDKLTQEPADRENVSLYIYEHPQRFRLGHLYASSKVRRPDLRLTVDTQPDLDLVRQIYEALYARNSAFSLYDVIQLLEQQLALVEINRQIRQKAVRE
jgi:spore coat polysaccharide biosynthesis protein SpsF